jgi:hypothetical protein
LNSKRQNSRQTDSGVLPANIECKEDLVLIFKLSDGSSACVMPHTKDNLMKREWIKPIVGFDKKLIKKLLDADSFHEWADYGTEDSLKSIALLDNQVKQFMKNNPSWYVHCCTYTLHSPEDPVTPRISFFDDHTDNAIEVVIDPQRLKVITIEPIENNNN